MAHETVWHEPDVYQAFHCLGATCEDSCCAGWRISVDRQTFESYQQAPATTPLRQKLQQLVQISPASGGIFAQITLDDAVCPFLSDAAACEIQNELGESALGQACATFPRVINAVEGAIERSLDLSCPEAARMVLLRTDPAFFQERTGPATVMDGRLVQMARERGHRHLPSNCDAVRQFVIDLLQNRTYSVARRLTLLGYFCDQLDQLGSSDARQLLDGFQLAADARLLEAHLEETQAEPIGQLGLVLELVVARMAVDYTTPRFRELYGKFSAGLQIAADSSISELGRRYSEAYFTHYAGAASATESILEQYLVSCTYQRLFPFGSQGSITDQYLLLASNFAMIRTLAVGLAAHYGTSFGEMHLVRAIQVSTRALDHCATFPARVLEILASKGIRSPVGMSILTQELRQPTA